MGIGKLLVNKLEIKKVFSKEKDFEKGFNLKYAEPQIRFKILDKQVAERFFSGVDDIAIPRY